MISGQNDLDFPSGSLLTEEDIEVIKARLKALGYL